MKAEQQGTGAVNAEGKVMIFVAAADWRDFVEFMIEGETVTLVAGDGLYLRRYGRLTVDAARRMGKLVALRVDEAGKPSGLLELEARRGR